MLGARTAAWARAGGVVPTARDYVQDGLVHLYDGEANSDSYSHQTDIDTLKDQIGDVDLVLQDGVSVEDKSIFYDGTGNSGLATFGSEMISSDFVIEGVIGSFAPSGNPQPIIYDYTESKKINILVFNKFNSNITGLDSNRTSLFVGGNDFACYQHDYNPTLFSFSIMYENAIATRCLINGQTVRDRFVRNGASFWGRNGKVVAKIPGSTNYNYPLRLYSFRVYSDITPEHESANYAIDKARFNLPDKTI